MGICSHRCDREVPVWCGYRSLILAGELQRNGGKCHCHLSSCCLKNILSQGHWEGLRLRILRPNPSGEFFWLPQSVFSGFTWPTICVWFRTLFLESFLNCDTGFAFYFERELHFSQKKEDCLKKTALENHFFEDSYWQVGALYVLWQKYILYRIRFH